MKETIKTSRASGYLEKIFRVLNAEYFENKLEEPIITIQSTPKAYGHVTVAKAWHRADGGQRHELNVGAGTLDRPIESVVSTVLHEMVHLWNLQIGVQDCSRAAPTTTGVSVMLPRPATCISTTTRVSAGASPLRRTR